MRESRERMQEIDELSFETAFNELEETVRKLEAGEFTLDESLELFKRGQVLAAHCQRQLDTAELKVQQILPTSLGEPQVVPFEVQE